MSLLSLYISQVKATAAVSRQNSFPAIESLCDVSQVHLHFIRVLLLNLPALQREECSMPPFCDVIDSYLSAKDSILFSYNRYISYKTMKRDIDVRCDRAPAFASNVIFSNIKAKSLFDFDKEEVAAHSGLALAGSLFLTFMQPNTSITYITYITNIAYITYITYIVRNLTTFIFCSSLVVFFILSSILIHFLIHSPSILSKSCTELSNSRVPKVVGCVNPFSTS